MSYFDQNGHEEEGHDESNWLVSYGDLMTLLVGFFIILYSFSKDDEQKFDSFSKEITQQFKGKSNYVKIEDEISDDVKQIRALHMLASMYQYEDKITEFIEKIEKSYEKKLDHKEVMSVLEGYENKKNKDEQKFDYAQEKSEESLVELIVPSDTLFASGSVTLSTASVERIQRLSKELLQVKSLVELEIVGHTDSIVPSAKSTYGDNYTLSAVRAGAVAKVFMEHGFDKKKIKIRGAGDSMPLVNEKDEKGNLIPENLQKNRRIQIVIKQLPEHEGGA